MSEIKMKVGEYYETRYGDRWKCVAEIPVDIECKFVCCNSDGSIETFTKNGCFYADEDESICDLHRHLRGCTGFDWKEPKFKVGDVVYVSKPKVNDIPGISWVLPMDQHDGKQYTVHHVTEGGHVYLKGVCKWEFHPDWLSKEPPAAQYRQFANDEEYAPHFDRPVKRARKGKEGRKGWLRLQAFDQEGVWKGDDPYKKISYREMYENDWKFADTNEPFGVKI